MAETTDVAPDVPVPIDVGVAGGSALAEFERRRQKRVARVRADHPRLGGLILAVTDDPQSTRAWDSGARGERAFAARMAELGDRVIALHDRRVPRTRGNIDHVVVTPSGVFVVDAKRYVNQQIGVRRTGGLLSPVREQLMVGGRDQTKLVDALGWQVAAVRRALTDSDRFRDVSITAALCFVDGLFPMFGTVDIGPVPVRGLKGIGRLIGRDGPMGTGERDALARLLAIALPAKIR